MSNIFEKYPMVLIPIIVTSGLMLTAAFNVTDESRLRENCNVLINSERVINEDRYDGNTNAWREDLYFHKMWLNPNYQCDKFYDKEYVMMNYTKGDRL